eukprot:gnl/TRDRNA2_/TRDRNA2_58023_c0_seq1.p2 gnl/TRDRNA2_/TRDRNA2_58023_c0~~gnl/TRDRNA2_/TRDRNA2_58023_c0_seq1.p2  ORF type:complete len:218 (-),score=47.40 gnl/TRDRNA2_/TRDRNA2_58023_c0_seq1:195-848(-)
MMSNKEAYVQRLQDVFRRIDEHHSGDITIEELHKHLCDEHIQAYLSTLELDSADAWTLFKLLDTDETNVISIEDFVEGCMKLKGAAKSIDMAQMKLENKWMMKKMESFMAYVEQQFKSIEKLRELDVPQFNELANLQCREAPRMFSRLKDLIGTNGSARGSSSTEHRMQFTAPTACSPMHPVRPQDVMLTVNASQSPGPKKVGPKCDFDSISIAASG